jgi:hypothetical protein
MQILDNTVLRKINGRKKKGQQLNNALCRKLQCFPGLFVIIIRGVQNNRLTEKTEEKLTEKTKPK